MVTRGNPRFHLLTREHYYHVGSTEDLRHPMIEALITNFPVNAAQAEVEGTEQLAFSRKIAVGVFDRTPLIELT